MRKALKLTSILLCLTVVSNMCFAQTDIDAIMMEKKQLCLGPMYSYSSWKNYWEGTLKRNNENLGTVSTQMFSLMGAYGITDKLNVLFAAPYVKTKPSAGVLHGMQGVQDLSLFIKYMPLEKELGKGTFSFYTIGGVSFPLTNYTPDFLPLSIGLRSKTASLRLMADYQVGNIFVTASGTYVLRDNIKIDRNSYYTTHLILSNEVNMPNASNLNVRAGYRSDKLILEAVLNKWTTIGGFDMHADTSATPNNNMPFPSNKMNATTLGVNFKYTLTQKHNLFITGGANATIAGRNMGQSTTYYGGLFYVIDFIKKGSSKKSTNTTTPAKK